MQKNNHENLPDKRKQKKNYKKFNYSIRIDLMVTLVTFAACSDKNQQVLNNSKSILVNNLLYFITQNHYSSSKETQCIHHSLQL